MANIKIILGSTRPGRFGDKPAKWINELARKREGDTFELIDLAEVNLPLLDEATPPIMGKYEHQHTKDWAKTIGEADGFIIVTAEYNHGAPAAIKNAIDFAGTEWAHKPASFVSYGAEAGGTRAVEHLRGNLAQLAVYGLKNQVVIPNYWNFLDENGAFVPTEEQTASANQLLDEIVFWANQLYKVRQEMA